MASSSPGRNSFSYRSNCRSTLIPASGWISFYLQEPEDVGHAISLFRLSFDLATKKHQPATNEEP